MSYAVAISLGLGLAARVRALPASPKDVATQMSYAMQAEA